MIELLKNRKLVIATMHTKELVISPFLEQEFGVHCITSSELNTDVLGTFSGEVERTLSPVEAAREKCKRAMELTNTDLAVASEGSFGAHPTVVFLAADEEWIVLVDKKNNYEVVGRKLSTQTNYNSKLVYTLDEANAFAKEIGFPDHGIILKNTETNFEEVHKGITDQSLLENHVKSYLKKYEQVWIETDMRANYNPTRMKVIEEATQELIKAFKDSCPQCGTPGLKVTETKRGLPCRQCGLPTKSILSVTYCCQKCNYSEERKNPQGKEFEEPIYCDFCNP